MSSCDLRDLRVLRDSIGSDGPSVSYSRSSLREVLDLAEVALMLEEVLRRHGRGHRYRLGLSLCPAAEELKEQFAAWFPTVGVDDLRSSETLAGAVRAVHEELVR